MSGWSDTTGGGEVETGGAVTAASDGTSVTSGTADVKGAWAEMIASTARHTDWLQLQFRVNVSTNSDYLIDIGVGGAGVEEVIIPNIYRGSAKSWGTVSIIIPVQIPAGTRVAVRCQSSGASKLLNITIQVGSSPFYAGAKGLHQGSAPGANTTTSGGVAVDAGATINTKGAYTVVVASSSDPIQWLYVLLGLNLNGTTQLADWLFDIAVGAESSEEVIIPNLHVHVDATESVFPPALGPFPVSIPAGTRIAARCQSNINDATDRILSLALLGMS